MIIFAPNIHTGGGKSLLVQILEQSPFGTVTEVCVDQRFNNPIPNSIRTHRVKRSIKDRLWIDYQLTRLIKPENSNQPILFFGNLPPVFPKKKHQRILYIQNCFLLNSVPLPKDNWRLFLRLALEKIYLHIFIKNVDEIWVQTPWMKSITEKDFPHHPVFIKPIYPTFPAMDPTESMTRDVQFLFVGTGLKYKGFSRFVQSLKNTDRQINKKIKVVAVLDGSFQNKSNESEIPQFENIDFELIRCASKQQMQSIYQRTCYLVAASEYESFYLPQYEAHHFGCGVIAPKCGYTDHVDFIEYKYSLKDQKSLEAVLVRLATKSDPHPASLKRPV